MAEIPVRENPNPYLRSYYAAKGLNSGDTWSPIDYQKWVDTKAAEFWQSSKRTPEEKTAFAAFLEQEAKLEYQRSHGELIQVLIPINELANRCGHFFNAAYNGGPCVNNGYNCYHPDAEQEDGVGCCYTKECPIAYPADGLTCRRCGSSCENCGSEDCACDLDMMVAEIPTSEYNPTVMDLIPDGPDTKTVHFAVLARTERKAQTVKEILEEADFSGTMWCEQTGRVIYGAVETPAMENAIDSMYAAEIEIVLMTVLKNMSCQFTVTVDAHPVQTDTPEDELTKTEDLLKGVCLAEPAVKDAGGAMNQVLHHAKKALFEQLERM